MYVPTLSKLLPGCEKAVRYCLCSWNCAQKEGLTATSNWELHVLHCIFSGETSMANGGPNVHVVSVVCLKGCWSATWCRPDRFGARKTFSASNVFDGSNCTIRMGKKHSFCQCFGLLKAYSSGSCVLHTHSWRRPSTGRKVDKKCALDLPIRIVPLNTLRTS